MRQLLDLRRYADRLHAILAAAQAGVTQAATGSDRSGTVTIAHGSDGIPESARVEADWLRRLPSDRFADAVVPTNGLDRTAWSGGPRESA